MLFYNEWHWIIFRMVKKNRVRPNWLLEPWIYLSKYVIDFIYNIYLQQVKFL
jgi:hypothetical protein